MTLPVIFAAFAGTFLLAERLCPQCLQPIFRRGIVADVRLAPPTAHRSSASSHVDVRQVGRPALRRDTPT